MALEILLISNGLRKAFRILNGHKKVGNDH
jgi:hypothetical protein